jgi:acetyltransferase-like isoleucine patch superfamily enzyme
MLPGLFMPWPLKRLYLQMAFGWSLHRSSRIGCSIVLADRVVLEEGARIGHFNIIMPIGLLHIGPKASLGYFNKIIGGQKVPGFSSEHERMSALIIEEHAAVTRDHIIDCSNTVRIGRFTTFAGYRSQILTHSPDLSRSAQTTRPVTIGAYCFIGTGTILLYGSEVPDYSIVSAGSVYSGSGDGSYAIYAGNLAKRVKSVPQDLDYFTRTVGRFKE